MGYVVQQAVMCAFIIKVQKINNGTDEIIMDVTSNPG